MRFHTIGLASVVAFAACSQAVYGPQLHAPAAAPATDSVHGGGLKVHLQSGELVVLNSWLGNDSDVSGVGIRYDVQRRPIRQGQFVLPVDSIALLESETGVGSRPDPLAGMALWTIAMGATTAVCVANPKSCFGSCPTFYVASDTGETLAAEGFSGSIARALEAEDLDALYPAHPRGGPFLVRMRNEALETHAVKRLTLLAAPRPAGGRIFASADGTLYPATVLLHPLTCRAEEGDCLAPLAQPDGAERTSPADSTDLAATETIDLTFPPASGRVGLVIGARQSLMSTYLFYQTMGFLGSHAGEALAAMERGGPAAAGRSMGMARIIAPIVVEVWERNGWKRIGIHDEAGPLATQIEVLPFRHDTPGPVHVRLTMSRGAWRLDWSALADLGDPVTPIALEPLAVDHDGAPDSTALTRLLDPTTHLFTYPGDTYDIEFRLPSGHGEWEVFLRSEGYYYEWMRREWLADENPALAAMALSAPRAALRALAPGFKRVEPTMNRQFWSSKFGR